MSNPNATVFAARVSVGFAGTFAPLAVQLAFMPVWLAHVGFAPDQIGLLLGVALAGRVILVPLLVAWSDRFASRRTPFIAYAGTALVGGALLLLPNHAAIAAGVMLVLIAGAAIIPLVDAISLSGVVRFGLRFGRMRLWGSVAFIAVTLASGWLVERFGIAATSVLIFLTVALSVGAGFALPTEATTRPAGHRDTKGILADRTLVFGLTCGSLTVASHATFYAFGSIYWVEIGFEGGPVAWFWAIGVVAEVALLAIVGKRFAPPSVVLLSIGAVGGIVRWTMFTIEGGTVYFVVNSLLHAATFAAAYLGTQQLIAERVPVASHGSAQAFTQWVSGPASALLTLGSGWLYARYGNGAFLLPAVLCGISLLFLVPLRSDTAVPVSSG